MARDGRREATEDGQHLSIGQVVRHTASLLGRGEVARAADLLAAAAEHFRCSGQHVQWSICHGQAALLLARSGDRRTALRKFQEILEAQPDHLDEYDRLYLRARVLLEENAAAPTQETNRKLRELDDELTQVDAEALSTARNAAEKAGEWMPSWVDEWCSLFIRRSLKALHARVRDALHPRG